MPLNRFAYLTNYSCFIVTFEARVDHKLCRTHLLPHARLHAHAHVHTHTYTHTPIRSIDFCSSWFVCRTCWLLERIPLPHTQRNLIIFSGRVVASVPRRCCSPGQPLHCDGAVVSRQSGRRHSPRRAAHGELRVDPIPGASGGPARPATGAALTSSSPVSVSVSVLRPLMCCRQGRQRCARCL